MVDANTLRVVAYCPDPADAETVVHLIGSALGAASAARAKLREWQGEDGGPTPLAERNRHLKARNRILRQLVEDLAAWAGTVPEPLPAGLGERVRAALGRPAKGDRRGPVAVGAGYGDRGCESC